MMESLENLTNRPEGKPLGATSGDLLSHVLAQIRLTGDVVLPRTLTEEEHLDLNADEAHVIVVAAGALRMSTTITCLLSSTPDISCCCPADLVTSA
jgi:hypothetical protein